MPTGRSHSAQSMQFLMFKSLNTGLQHNKFAYSSQIPKNWVDTIGNFPMMAKLEKTVQSLQIDTMERISLVGKLGGMNRLQMVVFHRIILDDPNCRLNLTGGGNARDL